jgi:hypothetical protein
MAAEDWSQSIVFLCRSCSEGVIHERHDDDLRATRPELAAAAAAINEESLGELIDAWRQRAGYEGRVGWTLVGEDERSTDHEVIDHAFVLAPGVG